MTMPSITAPRRALASRSGDADRRLCRRLVMVTYPLFLGAVAARRLAGRPAPLPGAARPTIFAEATALAYATIPFLLMG